MTPDHINALFEAAGCLFVLANCRAVLRDKRVAGVSIAATVYFTAWGIWNLYFYPSLNQAWSFYAGAALASANFIWVCLLIRYGAFHVSTSAKQ